MAEFHFVDPDLKTSELEIRLPSCPITKDNFTDSQGKQTRVENKEPFQAEVFPHRYNQGIRQSETTACPQRTMGNICSLAGP